MTNTRNNPAPRRRRFLSPGELVFYLLGAVLILFVVAPVIRMIATTDPAALTETAQDREVIGSVLLTLRAAFWATLLGLVAGVPLAYLLARRDFPGRAVVEAVVDIPVIIPHSAAGIALLAMYGRRTILGKFFGLFGIGFIDSEAGIVLAMAFVSVPFLVNTAKEGFRLVPERLEHVARTLGASPWQVFWHVSVPLCKRAIGAGAILMWARGISEFGAVLVLAYHPTITPVLLFERFEQFGLRYAAPVATLLILICLVIFFLFRFLSRRKRHD